MIHGFTGSPESVRPWAQGLRDAGFTVLAPALPGHSTTWQDLNSRTWEEMYDCVEAAFLELRKSCDRIFVAGFSVGGALALRLAQIRGSEYEGTILCNASIFDDRKVLNLLPVVKHLLPSIKSGAMDVKKPKDKRESYERLPLKALDSIRKLWRNVEENLYLVDLPLMVSYSVEDHVVHPINSETIIDNVYSADIREVIFENSYHNVPWDNDCDVLVEESVRFIHDVLSGEILSRNDFDEEDLINAEFESIVSGLNLDQSTPTTYLDELETRDRFRPPHPTSPQLQRASRLSVAAIIASAGYLGVIAISGGDPLGLGGWPALVLFATGLGSLIWRTAKSRNGADGEDGEDGAVL